MAFRDSWHRALVYFGLAEERDPYEEEEPAYEPEAELEDRYRERPNVRRLGSRRRRDDLDDHLRARGRAGGPHPRAPERRAARQPPPPRRLRRHLRRRGRPRRPADDRPAL